MKTITHLILGIALVSFNAIQAQEAVEIEEVNVAFNYKTTSENEPYKYEEVRYYYYPNLQAYFDTKVGLYLYQENGEWVESERLAPTFRGYSLKNGQYVMIKDYVGEEPYTLINDHKAKFPADYSSRPKREVAAN